VSACERHDTLLPVFSTPIRIRPSRRFPTNPRRGTSWRWGLRIYLHELGRGVKREEWRRGGEKFSHAGHPFPLLFFSPLLFSKEGGKEKGESSSVPKKIPANIPHR
jgi:hypothetical protein